MGSLPIEKEMLYNSKLKFVIWIELVVRDYIKNLISVILFENVLFTTIMSLENFKTFPNLDFSLRSRILFLTSTSEIYLINLLMFFNRFF